MSMPVRFAGLAAAVLLAGGLSTGTPALAATTSAAAPVHTLTIPARHSHQGPGHVHLHRYGDHGRGRDGHRGRRRCYRNYRYRWC